MSFERSTREQLLALSIEWPDDVIPIATGRYGSLAIRVPAIDVTRPFEAQVAEVDEAFAAMQKLVPFEKLSDRLVNR